MTIATVLHVNTEGAATASQPIQTAKKPIVIMTVPVICKIFLIL